MSNLKKHLPFILMAMLILLIMPMSFAMEINESTAADAIGIDDVDTDIVNINDNSMAYNSEQVDGINEIDDNSKLNVSLKSNFDSREEILSDRYDYESVPNETEINYILGDSYPIQLSFNFDGEISPFMDYVYAYVGDSAKSIEIKSPNGYDIYAGSHRGIVDINSFCSYLHEGTNTVVFHPSNEVLSGNGLINNNFVALKIFAKEPEETPTVYYVDKNVLSEGDGSQGSIFKTIASAIAAANEKFDEFGSIIIKNGVYEEPNTINIEKSMEIKAAEGDEVIIKSTGENSLFSQTIKADVTLSGLTFKNSTIISGAIYYQNGNAVDGSTLIIQSCDFINNQAPTLVRLYKSYATFKHDNFIENKLTDTGLGRGGLINYYETGTSKYQLNKYIFDVSYSNIIGNTLDNGYYFTSNSYQTLVANNNYWGSNLESKPTKVYNKESDPDYLTLTDWTILDATAPVELQVNNQAVLNLQFLQNDGNSLGDSMADLTVDLISSLDATFNPASVIISNNKGTSIYIAPSTVGQDTISVRHDANSLTSKDVTISKPVSNVVYETSVDPSTMDYVIGKSAVVTVIAAYDSIYADDLKIAKMFVYINGEEITDRVEISGLTGDIDIFKFDLTTISDKLVVGENILTFHPHIGALEGTVTGEYVFNPLTVNASEPITISDYDYESIPNPVVVDEYVIGDDKEITINVVSDYLEDLNGVGPMFAWINGESKNNRFLISGVGSGASSFTFNLADVSDKLVVGENTITFHPLNALIKSFSGSDNHNFVALTVNAKNATITPDIKYVSTPTVNGSNNTEYIIGEHKNINIAIDCDVDFESYDKVYVYIDGYNQPIDVYAFANINPETIDLKSISDKFSFEIGKEYTLYFHPDLDNLNDDYHIKESECLFNPLKVTVIEGEVEPPAIEYTINLNPNQLSDYNIGDSQIITVTANYSEAKASNFEYRLMCIYINGKEIKMTDVLAKTTSFTFDLADYVDELVEGINNISVHPPLSALQVVFGTMEDVFVLDNLTVNAKQNSKPELSYSITLSPDQVTNFIKGDNKIINVVANFTDSAYVDSQLSPRQMYIYINGEEIALDGVKANARAFTFDLNDYSDKLMEGVNNISVHPQFLGLDSVFSNPTYEINNLTVTVINRDSTYTTTPVPNVTEYTIGEDKIITVDIKYDSYFSDSLSFAKVFVYINGESMDDRVEIDGILANETTFEFNLKNIADKLVEGQNNLTFHPHIGALQGIFAGPYTFNKLIVDAKVPELPIVPTFNVTADSSNADYIRGESCNVTVSFVFDDVYADAEIPVYIYVGDGEGILINGVKANSDGFTIDLSDYDEILADGINVLSFHPAAGDLDEIAKGEYSFANVTVNVTEPVKPRLEYIVATTPSVVSQYINGTDQIINVVVEFTDSDYVNDQLALRQMYICINGEEIVLDGVKANENFTFNLADYGDRLTDGINNISVYPEMSGLDSIFEIEVYESNNLTVAVINIDSSYTTSPEINVTDYAIGEDKIITVNVKYDDYFNDDLSFYSMFVHINGEESDNRVSINNIFANATSFEFNLKDISDKLVVGVNNLTFHPHADALEGILDGPFVFNSLIVNVEEIPEPMPEISYAIVPSIASIDYIIGENCIVEVAVNYNSNYSDVLGELPLFVFINDDKSIEINGIKANVSTFKFDLEAISEYLTVGKNIVSFHPDLSELSSIGNVKYEFGDIIVNSENAPVNPDTTYVTIPTPSKVDYTLNESYIITVTAVYDDYFNKDMSFYSMFVYINGEDITNRVKIPGILGNSTNFTFDLKEISDKLVEGQNNLTFHPHIGALEGTFVGPYTFYNLTVNVATTPEPVNPVNKINTTIEITANNVTVGETVAIDIIVPDGATGNVLVDVAGKEYNVTIEDGKASIDVSGLNSGNYSAKVSYLGDENYYPVNSSVSFNVAEIEPVVPSIGVVVGSAVEGEVVSVSVTLPDDAGGRVLVDVAGNKYYGDVRDGKAIVDIEGLAAGNYSAVVSYLGDDKYADVNASAMIRVDAKEDPVPEPVVPSIGVVVGSAVEGEVVSVSVTLPDDAGGRVLVDVAGKKYDLTVENGKASISIDGLKAGNYSAVVSYLGDDKYSNASTSANIKVDAKAEPIVPKRINPNMNVTVPSVIGIGSSASVEVELPVDATGIVAVKVNGREISTVPVKGGHVRVSLPALDVGTYYVDVNYFGDDSYVGVDDVNTITVRKLATHIVADTEFTRVAVDYFAKERGTYQYGYLLDENDNPVADRQVQITVNGVTYKVTTDSKGIFKLKINLKVAKKYDYTIAFKGDDVYDAAKTFLAKLTVTMKKTSISVAKKKTFKASAKKKVITVTLKTVKNFNGKTYLKAGKKISLKVNGKTYKAKTNAKGVAKFTIKLTKNGKFTAKIKFAGDKTYKASSKKMLVTIKK